MTSARATLDRAMSEDELSQAIIEAAILRGWLVHHIRRSDKALQQGHAGFPDLVLSKRGSLPMFLELKSEKGQVTPEQQDWLHALTSPATIATVIRPSDLDDVLKWLAR